MSSIAGVLANWSYFGQNLTIFAFNLPADISIGEILVIKWTPQLTCKVIPVALPFPYRCYLFSLFYLFNMFVIKIMIVINYDNKVVTSAFLQTSQRLLPLIPVTLTAAVILPSPYWSYLFSLF